MPTSRISASSAPGSASLASRSESPVVETPINSAARRCRSGDVAYVKRNVAGAVTTTETPCGTSACVVR